MSTETKQFISNGNDFKYLIFDILTLFGICKSSLYRLCIHYITSLFKINGI